MRYANASYILGTLHKLAVSIPIPREGVVCVAVWLLRKGPTMCTIRVPPLPKAKRDVELLSKIAHDASSFDLGSPSAFVTTNTDAPNPRSLIISSRILHCCFLGRCVAVLWAYLEATNFQRQARALELSTGRKTTNSAKNHFARLLRAC